ncbi:MAG: tetratricopeptide repeat protein [Pseudomonadota bacterium]
MASERGGERGGAAKRRLGRAVRLGAAALLIGWGASAPAGAASLEGAYLKAQYAVHQNDAVAAARYYNEALIFAPHERRLLAPAFFFSLMTGEARRAAALAPRLEALGVSDGVATLVRVAEAFETERYDDAEALLASEAGAALSPIMRGVLQGWAAYGRGDPVAAAARFTEAPEADESAGPLRAEALQKAYGLYGAVNLGLLEAAQGRDEAALEAFASAEEAVGRWTLRPALEAGEAMLRLGRAEEAIALYDQLLAEDPNNPRLVAAKREAEAGAAPAPTVETARDGAAMLLLAFGVGLGDGEQSASRQALSYIQLSRYLAPELDDARVAAAELLADLGQMRLAAEILAGVPPQAPLGEVSRIGRAEALARDGDTDGALTIMRRLVAEGPTRPNAFLTLGSLESVAGRHEECAEAYETALMMMPEPTWRVLLRLGICREQAGDWPAAEAAFVEALALEPRQADLLNHFGYGLVVQNRRLDEAREMIELAVELRPDSGYIVDSLGWVMYKLGDYEAAVTLLEDAVAKAPWESVINDHFGDALWRVGRTMEARFQWRRALSYEPEETDRPRIERKLAIGLDQVLAEEAEAAAALDDDGEEAWLDDAPSPPAPRASDAYGG